MEYYVTLDLDDIIEALTKGKITTDQYYKLIPMLEGELCTELIVEFHMEDEETPSIEAIIIDHNEDEIAEDLWDAIFKVSGVNNWDLADSALWQ